MNILFIIGNGFDLNLGMKTSYIDFYDYYQAINSKSESVTKLKKEIKKNLKNWSDLELALGKYTENLNSLEEFDEVFEDISEKLADYLELQEKRFDFGLYDAQELYDFLSFPERQLLKADMDKITAFKNNWYNTQWNLNVITFNYTRSIEKLLGENHKNVKIGTHNNNAAIFIQEIEHIHGYATDRMVMGVNDISQVTNKDFHNNQDILESLVKDTCNQAHKHTIENLCKERVLSANLICIFGSSIGDTDKIWWELIGSQLIGDRKLIIFNLGENISPRIGHKKARIEREIRDGFLKKTQLNEEEKKIARNNIFIGINTNQFKLTQKFESE